MDTLFSLLILALLVLLGLPIAALVGVASVRRRELELREELRALGDRLRTLERARTIPAPAAAPAVVPPPPPKPPERPIETVAVAPPPAARVTPPAPPTPPPPAPPHAAPAVEGRLPPIPSAPAIPATPPPPPPAGAARPPQPAWAPAPPTSPQRPPFDLLGALRRFDWEQIVGVKGFSILAGIMLAIAALFFAAYSYEHLTITPPVRFAILTAVGLALVVGSELRVAQGYRITAHSLAAGGIAALFTTFFAGHSLWRLYGALLAFLLLALVTAVAVGLSIRRSSLVVAVLGLLGGFATPVLLSTGENRPFGLFGYLLLLNAALSWVAYRRRWKVLTWLSLAFTALYQAGWVAKFLDRGQVPIALGVFLIFPLLGFAASWLAGRAQGAPDPSFRRAAAAGAVPPVLFALYFATRAPLAASWPLLLAFLVVIAAGLAAVAAWQGPEWLHPAGAAAVLLTVAAFLAGTFTSGDWPRLALYLGLLAAVYLGTPLLLARLGRDFRGEGRLAVLAAPLLLAAFARAAPEATAAAPLAFLAPLLLLAAACSAWAVLRAEAGVHVVSSALAILAAGHWSWAHLDPARLYPALLAYAALGGLLLAAPLLAERRGRPLAGAPAAPLLLLGLLLLLFLARPAVSVAVGSLAGLTLLVGLFQAALFWEASRGRYPVLALLGVLVGFVELALWAVTGLAAAVLPGLVAAAILAGVALLGAVVAAPRQRDPAAAQALQAGPFLALAGHLFLAAVAARRELALPAAPWLALLGVLDLGFLVAALLRRRAELLIGAAAATLLVLLAHLLGLGVEPPSPAIAGGAAVAAGAFFLAGFLLARRTDRPAAAGLGTAGAAAAVALHGGQVVLILCGATLPVAFSVPAHLALLCGLLALAWISGAELLTLSAALLAGLAAAALEGRLVAAAPVPADTLWLATPIWLAALAYPLLRGHRGRRERLPFIAAVVASGIYLLVARKALVALGAGPYIGALPVLQAALLVPHLRLLLRLEPPTERDLARLAVIGAALLGLVTVAIPLQLENEWWTIGWAAQAAALAWLWRRIPHRGLLAWSAALYAAAFVRLVPFMNVWVWEYHPRDPVPIWNWYLYAYLAVAAAHLAGAALLSRGDDRPWAGGPRLAPLAGAGGAVLLFFLLNIEIADYWSGGGPIAFHFSAGLAPDLSYTIGWALFAIGLLVAGVALRLRGPRIAAIALLAATVLKAFLHDLAHLTGLYRVASLVGLAVSLALVALVLQRFVLRRNEPPPQPAGPSSPPEQP